MIIARDTYNRRFTYLRLSITDKCNFRCNYCLPDGYSSSCKTEPLSVSEIRSLAKAFAINGTKKIRITGGEPTLRKDLAQIIKACSQTDGIETVALTSNGYRLAERLPELKSAGLTHLNLSADSLDANTFKIITGRDRLGDVLSAVDQAIDLGLESIKLNAVLLRQHNMSDLNLFKDYIKDRPVTVRFIELMQTGDNQVFFSQQHLRANQIQEQLVQEGWSSKTKTAHAGPAEEFTHPDFTGGIGLITPYAKDFCASCNRLRVDAQGKLHLCLFADDNIDIRAHLRDADPIETAEHIRMLLSQKQQGHALHEHYSGSTRNLAMLGG